MRSTSERLGWLLMFHAVSTKMNFMENCCSVIPRFDTDGEMLTSFGIFATRVLNVIIVHFKVISKTLGYTAGNRIGLMAKLQ